MTYSPVCLVAYLSQMMIHDNYLILASFCWSYNAQLYFDDYYPGTEVGFFMSITSIIGGTLGIVIGGLASDILAKKYGKQNDFHWLGGQMGRYYYTRVRFRIRPMALKLVGVDSSGISRGVLDIPGIAIRKRGRSRKTDLNVIKCDRSLSGRTGFESLSAHQFLSHFSHDVKLRDQARNIGRIAPGRQDPA